MSFIEEVAPAIVPIIQKLNEKINAQYHDEKVAIIDGENRVHMAHMDIHFRTVSTALPICIQRF